MKNKKPCCKNCKFFAQKTKRSGSCIKYAVNLLNLRTGKRQYQGIRVKNYNWCENFEFNE